MQRAALSLVFTGLMSIAATAQDFPKAGILDVKVQVTGHHNDPNKTFQGKEAKPWRDFDYSREAHVEIPLEATEYNGMVQKDLEAQNKAADAMLAQSGLTKADMAGMGNAMAACAQKFEACGESAACERQMQACAQSAALANAKNFKPPTATVKPDLTRFVDFNTPFVADVRNQHGCVGSGYVRVRDRLKGRELDSVKGWFDISGEIAGDATLPVLEKTNDTNDFCGTKISVNTKDKTYNIHLRFLAEANTTIDIRSIFAPLVKNNGRLRILGSDLAELNFADKPLPSTGSISGQETIQSGTYTIAVSWTLKPTSSAIEAAPTTTPAVIEKQPVPASAPGPGCLLDKDKKKCLNDKGVNTLPKQN
ncbi:hypothetical protein [Bradyrhizobium iriomotense]|uniref:hypothetical protein n=1 Tax=Bradyrhizobium iriomotense TaxID=441950 RepID=UPI001B8A8375|nr:hypothetical protein [Bradyrhizobium iriomotense]MBR0787011.1 hypothetical protein [Bradyrhizobium iriomotense]